MAAFPAITTHCFGVTGISPRINLSSPPATASASVRTRFMNVRSPPLILLFESFTSPLVHFHHPALRPHELSRFPFSSFAYQPTPEAAVSNTATPATITSVYPHSAVDSFALTSFYFGCLERANFTSYPNGPANLPQPASCAVTLRGYRSKKTIRMLRGRPQKADIVRTFDYTPEISASRIGVNRSAMALADLGDGWKGLRTVSWDAVLNGGPPTAGGAYTLPQPILSVDNVALTVWNASAKQ